MAGYTKLFSSIVASTVWNEDNDTRIVWITLLALADKSGVVEGSVPGLAVLARVSVDGCRSAIVKLSNPDPDSRSKVKDGRRIEAVEGGWRIVNHGEYRRKLSKDERNEYQRQWVENKRAKGQDVDDCLPVSTNVDDVDISRVQKQTQNQNAETDARAWGRRAPTLVSMAEHRNHAVCGRVCLPAFLHGEFARLKGGAEDTAREAVRVWAVGLLNEWAPDGPKADEPIGDDPLKFWRLRFREWQGTTAKLVTGPPKATDDEIWADIEAQKALRKARR